MFTGITLCIVFHSTRTSALSPKSQVVKYEKLHYVHGQGNFVLAMSEGFDDGNVCFYDLFRVKDGKLAEHGNTVEVIPSKEDQQNPNGKF